MTEENTQDKFWYQSLDPVGADPRVRPVEKSEHEAAEGPEEIGKTPILSGYGLPWQAYAVVGDRADPGTWHLPHHTKAVKKAVKGKIGYEHTVDWKAMPRMVYRLSRFGRMEAKLPLDPEQVLQAATHLAVHYIKAKKPVPDALAVLSYIGK